MGGSNEWDFSCISIMAWPAASNGWGFELWCRSTLFLSSWRWGLAPRKLCPDDKGLENTESDTWKSWRSIVVL